MKYLNIVYQNNDKFLIHGRFLLVMEWVVCNSFFGRQTNLLLQESTVLFPAIIEKFGGHC